MARVVAAALAGLLVGCGPTTQVAVHNGSSKATKVTLRDAAGSNRIDFPEVEGGARSPFFGIDWPSYAGLNVDASDNHENGTVSLVEGSRNVIRVFEDGTEPAVSVEAE